ncbi:MAG: kinase/pyrophosphorylase [Gammaproteobacteria bacterium]|nr:MAG: kinase/pyrophosphorylase [Gammaproteobacteria bacterium]
MTDRPYTRRVFYISDRTGITAETFGHTLLTQFGSSQFKAQTLPFIDSIDKANRAVKKINKAGDEDSIRPLVFSTLVDQEVKEIIASSNCMVIDFFDAFIGLLEQELNTSSSHAAGLSHGMGNDNDYLDRIDALNYTLANDDGASTKNYPTAQIILIGASRTGKTPTSLYLALRYGIWTANYPLAGDDIHSEYLPDVLKPYRSKLFGLTINPERLHLIRQQRRPNSEYASLKRCKTETRAIETIYHHEGIPYADTSQMSIEEITTFIMHKMKLKRTL